MTRRHRWSGPTRCCCRASPTSACVGQRILTDGPLGHRHAAPAALFGLDLPPLVHGVLWSLALNIARLYRRSRCARAPTPIERLQANTFVPQRSRADGAELPALALLGHGRGAERDGRALSRRGAHAHAPSRASPRRHRISLEPKDEADFRLVRHAEHILASAIGARVLAARAVAAAAQAHGLDQGGAASCSTMPMPRSSTTAKSCRPRSITCARASRCSTRTCS